jgi:hypothetical protein
MTTPSDPRAALRTPGYVRLLVLAAIMGAPIAAAAYGFLPLVAELQDWLYSDLPSGLGFDGVPRWSPLPLLALAGLLVALTIRFLPGEGGESPAEEFRAGGQPPRPSELPGMLVIIAVAVAYVAAERLRPSPSPTTAEAAAPLTHAQVPVS